MNFQDMHAQLLMDIGLSKLQARTYLALLKGTRATGYQIAKQLNEPVANTYKALESLQKEGLILLDDSARVKYYTAQPISHYLDQIELRFANKREVIENVIKPTKPEPFQEGIYWIENIERLYLQSSGLIEKSQDIVLLDSTHLPIEQIRDDLQKAAKRGMTVLIKSYTEVQIPGCEIVFSREMRSPLHELPIQYFHLVIPGEGYITALLDSENRQLLYGVYTQNLFLSIMAYNGLLSEFFLTKTLNILYQGQTGQEVLEEWKRIDPIRPSRTSAWEKFIISVTSDKDETSD